MLLFYTVLQVLSYVTVLQFDDMIFGHSVHVIFANLTPVYFASMNKPLFVVIKAIIIIITYVRFFFICRFVILFASQPSLVFPRVRNTCIEKK